MTATPFLEPLSGRARRRLCPEGEDLEELAAAYARSGESHLRDGVARCCQEWSAALARGVARGSSADPEDLAQVALLAVVRALERYDPDRGPFEPYARATVAGEVRHYLRATEWPLNVPRRLQDAYRNLARARDELAGEGAGSHTEALAAAAGIPVRDVVSVTGLRRRIETLDVAAERGPHEHWLAETDARLDAVPERADLASAIAKLAPLDRQLVFLYFFRETSQREMARELGTNQVRISRMLAQALGRLRAQLRG